MKDVSPTRGGAGRGQGRKPLDDAEETVGVSVKMTISQRAKFKRLGGGRWLRDRIDKAKEPLPAEEPAPPRD